MLKPFLDINSIFFPVFILNLLKTLKHNKIINYTITL